MKDAVVDSVKVLIPGQAPMVLTPTGELTELLATACSLLSIIYTLYRFYKTGKEPKNKENGTSRKKEK